MYKYKPKNKKWSKLGSLVAETANAVKQEGTQLQQHIASKPPAYHSKYQDQLDNIVSELEDRSTFQYDINSDVLFQRYKDAYVKNGITAMQDTIGQGITLTGGYGSSYAQKVGQQTYQGHLQQLGDVIPALYQLAREKYTNDTFNLQKRYALYSDLEAQDYSKWQKSQDEYYTKLQQFIETTGDQDAKDNVSKKETLTEKESTKLEKYQFIGVDDNGKYRYSLGGKQYVYVKGTNPHTGTVNEDVANGTFGRSGYQPDNIGGKKLTWSGQYGIMNGHEQKIWMKPDGTLWMWDDTVNSYVPHENYVEVDTDATRSFRASVLRKNEFRRTNGQKNRPASYNDYLEETLDQWLREGLLNDTEAATLLIQYGLISKGNSQVPTQKNSADRQNGSGKQSSARRSERLEKIKGKLLNGDFCADMTVEDVMAFVSDAQTFMEETAKAYSNLTWEQATSADYEAKRKKRSEDLTGRATQVRTFLNANKGSLDPDVYENYMQYLNAFAEFQNQSTQDFEKAYRSYSEFETQEAYDQALSASKQMIEWEQKYAGMSHAELKDAISKLEDGAEKEWLASYTTSQMTHQDYTMDIAIAEWDLYRMENELEEFDYLSRWELTEEEKVREDRYRNKYGTVQDLKRLIEEKKEYIWGLEKGQKYNLLSENEDYAYQSTKVADEPTAGWGVSAWGKWYGQGDEIYDYVNDIDGSRERIRSGGDRNDGDAMYYHLSFMSEDEISKYNYLYNTSGRDAANEYLDYLKYDLNKRRQAKIAADHQKFAIEHPDLANLYSIGANLASGIGLIDIAGQNAVKGIKEAVTGEYAGPIDYHTPAMNPNTISTSIRYTRAQTLANKYGVININEDDHPLWASIFNGKSLGDVYQLGMSMADSAAVLAMSPFIGPYGVVLLGGSAGTQGVLDAIENGATDEQALAMGTLNGFFEMFFEKYSLETLLSSGGRKFADALWRNAVAEGSEEFFTSAANNISDILIMAEKSGYMRNVKAYIEDGYSESGAMQKAFLDMGIEMGWDFLGGMISGGIMGGAGNIATNAVQQMQGSNEADISQTIDGTLDDLINPAHQIPDKKSLELDQSLNDQPYQEKQSSVTPNIDQRNVTIQTATNQANTSINRADVAESLRGKGIPSGRIDSLVEAIVARVNDQELTRAQRDVLRFELGRPSVQKVINELIQKKSKGVDRTQNNMYDKNTDSNIEAGGENVLRDSLNREVLFKAQQRETTSETDVWVDTSADAGTTLPKGRKTHTQRHSKGRKGTRKPYATSRPSYGKGQVEQVWENAKDPITGKVYDPSGVEITWDPTKPRNGQWDMGHMPDAKYSVMHQLYMDDLMSLKDFLEWYRNPENYRPELPSTNRSHQYE